MSGRTELPVVPHPLLGVFATEAHPLRPSRVARFVACPMSVCLSFPDEEGLGNRAAQTGNLIHEGVKAFHLQSGSPEARVEAACLALEAAREKFPGGDPEKGGKILRSYATDPENFTARVRWVEQPVRLTLPPDPSDPTGLPVVIAGTLDQVREDTDGTLRVWDLKTGDRLDGPDTLLEYTIQQAVYTLAARASLDPKVMPGGLIYTPGYLKGGKTRKFLPFEFTIRDAEDLVAVVPLFVAGVRAGKPLPHPSVVGCDWCDHRPFPKCLGTFRGLF